MHYKYQKVYAILQLLPFSEVDIILYGDKKNMLIFNILFV